MPVFGTEPETEMLIAGLNAVVAVAISVYFCWCNIMTEAQCYSASSIYLSWWSCWIPIAWWNVVTYRIVGIGSFGQWISWPYTHLKLNSKKFKSLLLLRTQVPLHVYSYIPSQSMNNFWREYTSVLEQHYFMQQTNFCGLTSTPFYLL